MLEKFQGDDGRGALLNALRTQFLVEGNTDIAKYIAAACAIKEFAPGEALFSEGERGGDLYLIIAGQVSVRKNDEEIAICNTGMHVGEIGLLEPFKGRSATVAAIDTVVVAKITLQKFTEIAETYPSLWRRMALELAHRLVKTQDAV